ncbi:MAG: carbonic anhydrase [Paracoccaceae bacterium]|nr:carbonic anhydrase [Paracoccaceae bacterium]MDE2914095.1 carbonic anhydrase [Paracoccaceae bacterium]
MDIIKPLPQFLTQRFREWKATGFGRNRELYETLAVHGQHPRTMVISCCDSRVHATTMFATDPGEFFIHRNIAALVPPYDPNGGRLGTPAAVEYAVRALRVSHILVLGHSDCGGVRGCIDMCSNPDSTLARDYRFVGPWLDMLRPAHDRVATIRDAHRRQMALEREAVVTSLENLTTFPFVRNAAEAGELTLHGLWHDIGPGSIWAYDRTTGEFSEL